MINNGGRLCGTKRTTCPKPTPGEAGDPLKKSSVSISGLEDMGRLLNAGEQGGDGLNRRRFVFAFGPNDKPGSLSGRQKHDAEQAAGVHKIVGVGAAN